MRAQTRSYHPLLLWYFFPLSWGIWQSLCPHLQCLACTRQPFAHLRIQMWESFLCLQGSLFLRSHEELGYSFARYKKILVIPPMIHIYFFNIKCMLSCFICKIFWYAYHFSFQYQIIMKHFEDILEVIKLNSCGNKQCVWLKCGVEITIVLSLWLSSWVLRQWQPPCNCHLANNYCKMARLLAIQHANV